MPIELSDQAGRLLPRLAGLMGWLRQIARRLNASRAPLLASLVVLGILALGGKISLVVAILSVTFITWVALYFQSAGEDAALARVAAAPSADLQQTWRLVIEAMPYAAVALDGAGSVGHFNAQASELFPSLKPGLPFTNVSRNPQLIGAVDQAWLSSDRIAVEMLDVVPVERRIYAVVTRLNLAGGDPRPRQPFLLITFRDLSDEDRLAQMRADFIANASHELRTPLASLRGFVETLQGSARDDSQARDRFLAIMATQATRMTRMIDDLLSLSRAEMKVHVPPRGVVELNSVLGFVIQSMEPLADAASATVSAHLLNGTARIRGEREEIVQVLQNLVQNAIKYGRQDGTVIVKIERESGTGTMKSKLAVSVIDDGPGIAPEHLPRLTERFYRVNAASSREKGGTGLGLAIVKHIVNRHRGELRITSRLGEGSAFAVIFDELSGAT